MSKDNMTYLALFRRILDSEVWTTKDAKLLKVWLYCLIKATHIARYAPLGKGRGVWTEAGEFVFGRHKASEQLNMPRSTVWRKMLRLQQLGNVEIRTYGSYSIVKITNWAKYQVGGKKNVDSLAEKVDSYTPKSGQDDSLISSAIQTIYEFGSPNMDSLVKILESQRKKPDTDNNILDKNIEEEGKSKVIIERNIRLTLDAYERLSVLYPSVKDIARELDVVNDRIDDLRSRGKTVTFPTDYLHNHLKKINERNTKKSGGVLRETAPVYNLNRNKRLA